VSLRTSRPGLVNPRRIICAEPSPDAAIAVANSFGAGLSVFGYGSGSVSASQAEGLAQLAERTVTVQLLRDQMYRACESYANGAISGTTYTLLMSKNNDAMVTLMLAETAGGAFGRSLAAIGGGSSAEAQATLQGFGAVTGEFKQGVKDLGAANEKVDAAKEKVADKEAQRAALPDDADDATKAAALQEVDDAKKELAQAELERDQIAERLQSKSEAVAKSAAEVSNLIAAGGIDSKASPEIAKVLADMQSNLLDEDSDDEYISACLVELGLSTDPRNAAELVELDAANAYQNAQLEERDYIKYGIESEPALFELSRVVDHRLATAAAVTAQLQWTDLAKHCQDNLKMVMEMARDNKFKLDQQEVNKQIAANRTKFFEEFNKSAVVCAAMKTPAQQVQCFNLAAKIVDPSAKPVPVP
jgi:hypothetical protein